MRQIFNQFGKAMIAAVVVLAIIGIGFGSGIFSDDGLFQQGYAKVADLADTEDKKTTTQTAAMKEYTSKQLAQEKETFCTQLLSTHARYSVYDIIGFYTEDENGTKTKTYVETTTDAEGVKKSTGAQLIKIVDIVNNNTGIDVTEQVYDTDDRTLMFVENGTYQLKVHITDGDVDTTQWFNCMVNQNPKECSNASGHVFVMSEKVGSSCTEKGYTEYTCQYCGYSYKTDFTTVGGHNMVTATVSPTCTEEGYTICYCSNPSCPGINGGTMTYGGKTEAFNAYKKDTITALGHGWERSNATAGTDYTVAVKTEPTCQTEGVNTETCAYCSATREVATAKVDHVYELTKASHLYFIEAGDKTYYSLATDNSTLYASDPAMAKELAAQANTWKLGTTDNTGVICDLGLCHSGTITLVQKGTTDDTVKHTSVKRKVTVDYLDKTGKAKTISQTSVDLSSITKLSYLTDANGVTPLKNAGFTGVTTCKTATANGVAKGLCTAVDMSGYNIYYWKYGDSLVGFQFKKCEEIKSNSNTTAVTHYHYICKYCGQEKPTE